MNARMRLAVLMAERGTCPRRKIGAVLYDRNGEVLGEGWNGVDGVRDGVCDCPGRHIPAGAGNAACYGIHAEVRALMQAMQNHAPAEIGSCYSTKAPCTNCTLMLLATGCNKIVFKIESNETLNREIWLNAGRQWVHQPEE